MAFQMNFNSQYGINFPTAYIKVDTVTLNTSNQCVTMTLQYFANKDSRDSNATPLKNDTYFVSSDNYTNYFQDTALQKNNTTLLQASYDYLKTLPEFTNVIDC